VASGVILAFADSDYIPVTEWLPLAVQLFSIDVLIHFYLSVPSGFSLTIVLRYLPNYFL
jgi:hypothetical protein